RGNDVVLFARSPPHCAKGRGQAVPFSLPDPPTASDVDVSLPRPARLLSFHPRHEVSVLEVEDVSERYLKPVLVDDSVAVHVLERGDRPCVQIEQLAGSVDGRQEAYLDGRKRDRR